MASMKRDRPPATPEQRQKVRAFRDERVRRIGAALAGPLVIVSTVLFTMRGLLTGRVPTQHADLVTMWLPTFGYLGRAIGQFHVPDWNPYAFAGMPFAADPQSGWMYLPAMLFFSLFSGVAALTLLLLLNPLLAGLGSYGFLRSEGYGRPASTVAGLFVALPFAATRLVLSTPLIGALGWTAVMLAAASRTMRERRPSRVVVWGVATAICWGQVAGAHLSNGLAIASGFLVVYLAAVVVEERSPDPTWAAWRRGAILLASLPVVNAVALLPRLDYLGRSSIALGYATLDAVGQRFMGDSLAASQFGPTTTDAGLSLASLPMPYVGILGFAFAFAAWRSGSRRTLALGMLGALAVLTWFGSSSFARGIAPAFGDGLIGGFLTHEPLRFLFGEILVFGLLAGMGAESFLHAVREDGAPAAVVGLLPGAVLWTVVALSLGERFHPAALGLLAGVAVCAVAFLRPRSLSWALVALVAYDLVAAGFQSMHGPMFAGGLLPLHTPSVAVEELDPSRLELAVADAGMRGDRFAPWAEWSDGRGAGPWGYQSPGEWRIGGNGRGMLFGGMDVGGYNPSQPTRTWLAMRMLDTGLKRYNQSFVTEPPPALIDLLHLRWVIAEQPPAWATPEPVERDGRFSLFAVPGDGGLATFPTSTVRADDRDAALALVAAPEFDPATTGVWEGDAALEVVSGEGTATAAWERDDRLALEVSATRGGLLLVRVPWDPHWTASIDGSPATIVPADGFMSGVLVSEGQHRLVLDYDDPTIARGFLISALALLAAAALAWRFRSHEPFEVVPRREPTTAVLTPSGGRGGRRPSARRR